jgi:hypothetical protein
LLLLHIDEHNLSVEGDPVDELARNPPVDLTCTALCREDERIVGSPRDVVLCLWSTTLTLSAIQSEAMSSGGVAQTLKLYGRMK